MEKTNLIKKWTYSDAKQKKKKVGKYTLVLNYGTKRGGEILILERASKDDIRREQNLPHVYTVDSSHNLYLVETASYMSWENAKGTYDEIKNNSDVQGLIAEAS